MFQQIFLREYEENVSATSSPGVVNSKKTFLLPTMWKLINDHFMNYFKHSK